MLENVYTYSILLLIYWKIIKTMIALGGNVLELWPKECLYLHYQSE